MSIPTVKTAVHLPIIPGSAPMPATGVSTWGTKTIPVPNGANVNPPVAIPTLVKPKEDNGEVAKVFLPIAKPIEQPEASSSAKPVKLRQRPTPDSKKKFGALYDRLKANYEFSKASGSTGTLHLTGAENHISRNPEGIYNLLARFYGTEKQIKEYLTSDIIDVLKEKGVPTEELFDDKWNIGAKNIATVKADKESPFNQEISAYKKLQNTPEPDITNLLGTMETILKYQRTLRTTRTANNSDTQRMLRDRMRIASDNKKVLDVSDAQPGKPTYKTIKPPNTGGNSTKYLISTYPLCSNNEAGLTNFLQALGLSQGDLTSAIAEWRTSAKV